MGRCEACVWWRRDTNLESASGWCARITVPPDLQCEERAEITVILIRDGVEKALSRADDDAEGIWLSTYPDFGCMLFEARVGE